jgi:low affinity Fe/Cu permease
MKISKEIMFMVIVGLFLLAYLLDAVVNPLDLTLQTPYHYLNPNVMARFPFSTASIFIKSIALFMTPVWLLSFISQHYMGKASFLLVLASLVQLYALQDIVTKANVVPIEWSLSLSVAGLLLLVQAALFFMQGIFMHLKNNLTNARMEAAIEERLRESRENSI